MSGIKNIKKKLKGFRVRPPNVEVIKKVMLHIPYVVVFYVVNKCTWLYQYCRGSTVVDRLMVLLMNYPLAFKKLLPSMKLKSLVAGTIAAVGTWAVVYFKGKNGKKFRQGEEYGSVRWGNEKDIAPFIDPVFENNILLTQTERLTMNSRPKKPKYARNKNVIVIGGSGSGKTRFYVKPQLMQMPDNVSFVVTDPKGTIIVERGKMLARGTPKKDKNGKILRDKNGRVVMAPYIACGYTDLRRGIDGLASMVQEAFDLDPFTNTLFLFCGRRRDRIKALYWEGNGFVLLYKRLESGSFQWPRTETEARGLTPQQYRWLMEGLSIDQPKAHRPVNGLKIV